MYYELHSNFVYDFSRVIVPSSMQTWPALAWLSNVISPWLRPEQFITNSEYPQNPEISSGPATRLGAGCKWTFPDLTRKGSNDPSMKSTLDTFECSADAYNSGGGRWRTLSRILDATPLAASSPRHLFGVPR